GGVPTQLPLRDRVDRQSDALPVAAAGDCAAAHGAGREAGQSEELMTDTTLRRQRKGRTGTVLSDKMTKTVTVLLSRRFAHPVYGKQVTRSKRVKARNEMGARAGDTVRIMETRPLAK